MLPDFDATGKLPPGVHAAPWAEVSQRFGGSPRRQQLLIGLREGLVALHTANCRVAYLDGSFVTSKDRPGDFDVCYDVGGMDYDRMDPVLLTFANGRAAQKLRFGGEFFPSHWPASGTQPFLEFFQIDKESGLPKGIVAVTPGDAV
jgi:uncharacterized protein DUF6932